MCRWAVPIVTILPRIWSSPELIGRQSSEVDQEKRKQLVWQIERKLAEDNARPIIFYSRHGTCRQPYVKGLTLMVNSIFNGWRMEDFWLDK
jgi:peptide/nickel transport system substrate-binding protein